MNEKKIDEFEKTQAQLESLYNEIGILSKKSQNDALNKFKLGFVNKALVQANNVLGKEYIPFPDFKQFNDDDLPSNSDVTMILGQYLNCMEKLRADNIFLPNFSTTWYWMLDGDEDERGPKTSPPKKISNK